MAAAVPALLVEPSHAEAMARLAVWSLQQRVWAQAAARPGTTAGVTAVPDTWAEWLRALFRRYVSDSQGALVPFAAHQAEVWAWVWSLALGRRTPPLIAVWPRGAGKSTTAELACVAVAARGVRRYGLYVSASQDQADDHVGNVATMLESEGIARWYPQVARRLVGKYGQSRGWRRNRLRTESGFTLDAMGLDTSARGAKVDEDRPDWLVLDDLDGELDTTAIVERKLATLTRKLLPAASADAAVLGVQNLVHADSIFARLMDDRADFLAERIVSGPHPALTGFVWEQRAGRTMIVAGEPTWAGQDRRRCQALLDDMGLSAFLAECQQEVAAVVGGLFNHLDYRHCRWDEVPDLLRIVCWVDPAVTDKAQSDANGIQIDGVGADQTIYRLYSWEQRATPLVALQQAIRKALELGASWVGVETDQGGDTWESVYREAATALGVEPPLFRAAKAGAGHGPKAHRATQMLADYERGRIVHVLGTHEVLERALQRFPRAKPFDLVDAAYWAWRDVAMGIGDLPAYVVPDTWQPATVGSAY